LGRLPLDLVEALCSAIAAGDRTNLDNLILQVRQTDGAGADILKDLADKYEYDALTRLLEEARACPPTTAPRTSHA